MPDSFTKLASSIITSTVWGEDSDTKVVWITLLALSDRHGEIQGSAPGLARLAGVSVEACKRALDIFRAPDPDSRTQDREGRRIEDIDGGWALLNYAKYRNMASESDQREKTNERVRRHRANKTKPDVTADVTASNAGKQSDTKETTEAEAEAESKPNGLDRRKRASQLPSDWQPSSDQKAYARKQGCPDPDRTALDFKQYWIPRGGKMLDWNMVWQTWCRREANFKGYSAPSRPSQGGFNL